MSLWAYNVVVPAINIIKVLHTKMLQFHYLLAAQKSDIKNGDTNTL